MLSVSRSQDTFKPLTGCCAHCWPWGGRLGGVAREARREPRTAAAPSTPRQRARCPQPRIVIRTPVCLLPSACGTHVISTPHGVRPQNTPASPLRSPLEKCQRTGGGVSAHRVRVWELKAGRPLTPQVWTLLILGAKANAALW